MSVTTGVMTRQESIKSVSTREPPKFTTKVVNVGSCEKPSLCRLLAVRQVRALRRVVAGLESAYSCQLTSLLREIPGVPKSCEAHTGFRAVEFWEQIKAIVKKYTVLNQQDVRSFFPSRYVRRCTDPVWAELPFFSCDPVIEEKKNILRALSFACRRTTRGWDHREVVDWVYDRKRSGKLKRVRAGRDECLSLSFSLSLLGKSLLSPCSCYGAASGASYRHMDGITRNDEVAPDYLGFCSDMAKRLFRPGWDKSYISACTSATISSNACFQRPRKLWGSLADYTDQSQYLDAVCDGVGVEGDPTGRYSEVLSAGKIRPLSIMHSSYELLRPLHKTLYNYISRFPWLLRGAPSPEKFSGVLGGSGHFVSVDFENATDNLSINVAERILGVALSRARSVPVEVKEFAMRSLRPNLRYPGEEPGEAASYEWAKLSMGQMMGQLLSFPLLCCQTFFFYLYAMDETRLTGKQLRKYNRAKVNGDDLLFRAEDPSKFFEAAKSTPSVINMKKTQVSLRYFNINSTLFDGSSGEARPVPFLRPAQLDLTIPLDLGLKIREATRWLHPQSNLLRRSFDHLMSRGVRICKSSGWSFFKAGFRGQKQMSWLQSRGYLRGHETNVFIQGELPAPSEDSYLATKQVPAPEPFQKAPRYVVDELNLLFNQWNRFEKAKGLPERRGVWNIEREVRKQYVKVTPNLVGVYTFKGPGRIFPPERQSPPTDIMTMFPCGTGFPVAIGGKVYKARRNVTSACRDRLLRRGEDNGVLMPADLVAVFSGDKKLNFDGIHRRVIDRAYYLMEKLAADWCSSERARLGFSGRTVVFESAGTMKPH